MPFTLGSVDVLNRDCGGVGLKRQHKYSLGPLINVLPVHLRPRQAVRVQAFSPTPSGYESKRQQTLNQSLENNGQLLIHRIYATKAEKLSLFH